MLILKICPTPFFSDRGCHVRILEQTRALQNLGHRVSICTYDSGRNLPGLDIHRIASLGRQQELPAGPDCRKYYLDILLFFKTLIVVLKKRPQIIHAHLHEGAFIGYPLAKFFKIPIVLDLQGSLTDEMVEHRFIKEGSLPYRFNYWLEKRACLMADAILASSINLTNFLKNGFGLNKEKVELVEEGVRGDEDNPGEGFKKILKIPPEATVILYLGLLYPYQGIDDFLEAGEILAGKRKDLHFLIIGFPGEKDYEKKTAALGLRKYFTFTGRVRYENISAYLSLADIAVSPKFSRTESNSKLYHFMAQGIPTVTYDLPINHYILGEAGIYVKTGEVEALSRTIEELAEDEDRRKALSRQLKERARGFNEWGKVGKKIEGVYNRLLG